MFLTVDLIIISILIYKFYLQYSVSLVTDCNEIYVVSPTKAISTRKFKNKTSLKIKKVLLGNF